MAIENAKTLNVRIRNKYDSYENWASSSLVLEAGEIAIAYTSVDVKVDNGTAKHPALLMKVGNGTDTFANLPWMSAKAADVLSVCKNEADLTEFINNVIADAGIASDDAMQALAGRVDTAEGKITTLEGKMTAVEGKAAANEAAIAALDLLVGDDSVADQIKTYVDNLKLAETYAAKSIETTVANHIADTVAHVTTADKTKWNAALQASDIASGSANGTIAVKGTDVAITGLGSAAFTEASAYDAAGAAGQALIDAKAYADGLAGNYDAKGAAATAESNAKAYAKEYADGLAKDYDAAGSAAQALTDAKAYTDSEMTRLVGDTKVSDQISTQIANLKLSENYDAKGDAAQALVDAKAYADAEDAKIESRVADLEATEHTHSFVESELNLIQAGDVAKWNAAEQNAKDYAKTYADGLDEVMDGRVAALEAKFTGDDSVADQIADAVAAEAELREEAIADLQAQIGEASAEGKDATGLTARIEELEGLVGDDKVSDAIAAAVKVEKERAEGIEGGLETRLAAVEADYLTSTDKEALQTQINTIMNNPDAEDAINSINEFTAWVAEHGTIAEGMRTDINQNAADIAAEAKRAGEAEAELEGAINGVAADLETLEGVVDTKAAQDDLDDLAGRVTTAEGKITTLEGEMDDAQAAIEALEELVGDKKVSVAIEEAIEACKTDASNKDAVVLAEITAAVEQHNTDKAALEAEIAKKANDADLAAIAKTGSTDDLVQGALVLVFDCGGAE